jgi:regulator of protease activity HflC (stomatin/prohibitin superfamily)
MGGAILTLLAAVVVVYLFFRMIRVVPEQEAWILEQFGKYRRTMGAGLHLVVPVVQRVAYKHSLKEEVIDVPPQVCITQDNVQVQVDGLLYLRVVDPAKASYGIDNYRYATSQLAQTTMRSQIGRIDLDHSFSERDAINDSIVKAVDEASDPWGVKVSRYEIKDISPPNNVLEAMEQQMRAEREKRAEILKSEGDRESRINLSKGEREEAINMSRGERQRRINTAEGRARAIELTAEATAAGIREIAEAIRQPRGRAAMNLQIAEQYVEQLGRILKTARTSVLPAEIAGVRAMLDAVLSGRKSGGDTQTSRPATGRAIGSTVDKPREERS